MLSVKYLAIVVAYGQGFCLSVRKQVKLDVHIHHLNIEEYCIALYISSLIAAARIF